eukprot:SAG31_NODE_342_length_17455_cov_6.381251_5_plen_160_part_00
MDGDATAAIKSFQEQVVNHTGPVGRHVNALGQQEASVPRWRAKAEAKRQMYMQSTEQAPKIRLVGAVLEKYKKMYAKDPNSVPPNIAEAIVDQEFASVPGEDRKHRKRASSRSDKKEKKKRQKHKKKRKRKSSKELESRISKKRMRAAADSGSDSSSAT